MMKADRSDAAGLTWDCCWSQAKSMDTGKRAAGNHYLTNVIFYTFKSVVNVECRIMMMCGSAGLHDLCASSPCKSAPTKSFNNLGCARDVG